MAPPKSPTAADLREDRDAEAFTVAIRAEVRAEMGRQRKTQAALAEALEIDPATAASRLNGPGRTFDATELFRVGQWLGVRPESFYPQSPSEAATG